MKVGRISGLRVPPSRAASIATADHEASPKLGCCCFWDATVVSVLLSLFMPPELAPRHQNLADLPLCGMMEYKDDETDKLLQPSNEIENDPDAAEKNNPVQRDSTAHPFKKWMDSFRTRRRAPPAIPERYVEGWSDSSATDFPILSPVPRRGSIQDQLWERSSGRSSQLGTVKTATMSIASHSMARSRGTTQSATTQSAVSEMRISADSSRPISSNCMDEAAELRATKRRQVLRELLATETDYVQGMKALAGVSMRSLVSSE